MRRLNYFLAAASITGLLLTTQVVDTKIPNYQTPIVHAKSQEIVGHFKTMQQLEDIIANNENVAVDLSESWCKPCQRYIPVFREVAEEYKGKVVFYKVEMDEIKYKEKRKLIKKYNVEYIPKTVLFKNGKEVHRHEGFLEKEELKALIEKHLFKK